MNNYPELIAAILDGDDIKTAELAKKELEQGGSPQSITDAIQKAMWTVGEKFSSGEFFLPDMLMAARASTKATELLQPLLSSSDTTVLGKVLIGTVFGDIHDIGKNIVAMFLNSSGFTVQDIGINVLAERFIEAIKEYRPDIVGISALLTTTLGAMDDTIKAISTAGLRSQMKIIIGGAPVTQRFADQIGADGYARDGGAAIEACRKLMGKP